MEKQVQKIKILFATSMLLVISIIATGIQIVDNNRVYLSQKYLGLTFDYLKYKTEIVGKDGIVNAAGVALFDGWNIEYGREKASSVPVLAYHRLVDEPDGSNVTVQNFKDQMFYLKNNGYQTITLSDLEQFLKGEKKLPMNSIMITFDDGAKDSFYPADPILRVLDYNAVNFIIVKSALDQNSRDLGGYYLNQKELKTVLKSGRWEIGSHSYDCHKEIVIGSSSETGYCLTNLMWLSDLGRTETEDEYKARILEDLSKAKQELENSFDIVVNAFAFPFGDWGYLSKNMDAEGKSLNNAIQGFYNLQFYQPFTDESTLNNPDPDISSHRIRRIKVDPKWSGDELLIKIKSGIQ